MFCILKLTNYVRYLFDCNKEIIIQCNGIKTSYNGVFNKNIINTKYNFIITHELEPIINNKVVLVSNKKYSNKELIHYHTRIRENHLYFLIDPVLEVLLGKNKEINIEIIDKQLLSMKILYLVSTIMVMSTIYYLSGVLVKIYSKKDPILDSYEIKSTEIVKYAELNSKEIESCQICIADFEYHEDVRILNCKHYFHASCIDPWLVAHNNVCPFCKKSIKVTEKK